MYFRKLLIELHKLENKELIEEFNSAFIAFHLKTDQGSIKRSQTRSSHGFSQKKAQKASLSVPDGKNLFSVYNFNVNHLRHFTLIVYVKRLISSFSEFGAKNT